MKAPLAVSLGCPAGIGPEVAVRALRGFRGPVVLVGDRELAEGLAARFEVSPRRVEIVQPGPRLRVADKTPGRPTREGGAAQLSWIDAALALVRSGQASALVTGPVSKEAIATSGAPRSSAFRGHTEHLAEALRAREVVMAFWSRRLTTALVTTHLPLAAVPACITADAVASATFHLAALLAQLGHASPRVAIAGLNPHAGEGGLLGREEGRRIAPGIARARARLHRAGLSADLVGPLGAETAFRVGARGGFDGVVAQYHDQATIPMKLLGFGDAVNVTLGLPIVRTSVDHGTGYDVAGKGVADPRGMRLALDLAERLVRAKKAAT